MQIIQKVSLAQAQMKDEVVSNISSWLVEKDGVCFFKFSSPLCVNGGQNENDL
jgi:hypothetical protein